MKAKRKEKRRIYDITREQLGYESLRPGQEYEDDKMVVLFDEVGYKTLSVDIVTERGLLEQVQEG